ncbi:IPT/TIG domain containing protein [Clostridium botulinum]|uniref:Uncharacterized protein n=1 Tax=Clostridium botulinum TaxID=1491 RepID=A0A093W4C8_CLOBO|nr:hypothetical protein [Clostridium botulinum]AIW54672.1 hypothetical protein [Clostridium botulinum]AIW54921.1 hypothetical protein [Clostridium botulinum]AIW54976.1 hypothetical protein [Clostridium botulinum]AIW55030.1 hypothetical protein [Clostridium botulinum]KFX53731.1 hypothetical protein KU40_19210 [Clostridium botulinum]
MKKEDVYKFSQKVNLLLRSLEGVKIEGEDYKIEKIKSLYEELEIEIEKFSPTIREEYSLRTKILYNQMLKSKKEYEEIKKSNASKKLVQVALEDFKISTLKYENSKKIRDSIKNIN